MTNPFINLFRTKEEAFYFENSPINSVYNFNGVQLLPNNSTKYVQLTNTPDGINLEDWTVKAIKLCEKEVFALTSNLITYSEDLTQSDWTKNVVSISDKKVIASSGASVNHNIQQTITLDSSVTKYTISFLAKQDELTKVFLSVTDLSTGTGGNAYSAYNLATGDFYLPAAAFVGFTFLDRTITLDSDGYYKCTFTFNTNGCTSLLVNFSIFDSNLTFVGDGVMGLFMDKIQLKIGESGYYVKTTDTPLNDYSINITPYIDLTDYFLVEELTNSDNGNPQFYWSLTNVPYDFGNDLIYLQIEQLIGETFYSVPFKLTENDSEFTSQIHYKEELEDKFQSIGVQIYFRNNTRNEELTTYYELSTGHTVTVATQVNKLKSYFSQLMPYDYLSLLVDSLLNTYVYVNSVRCSLFESPKFPETQSQENFGEMKFLFSFKETDTFEGDYEEAVIPTIPDFEPLDYNSLDYSTT